MSALLLDTHLLLWAASGSDRLPPSARASIDDQRNDILFSVVSLWEISIKNALGRNDFRVDVAAFRSAVLAAGWRELPVRGHHVLSVAMLPPLHADPFDRMLLTQASADELSLLTMDTKVLDYGGPATRA